MTWDPNCYECKVRYRDPKPKDLVMYLHAWVYKVRKIHFFKMVLYINRLISPQSELASRQFFTNPVSDL